MRHETLFLNQNRTYVFVNDTWYDTHRELYPKVGQFFLIGPIEEILDYETYTTNYPEAKKEMYGVVAEKTTHGGFIRREVDGMVKYGVNIGALIAAAQTQREAVEE